MHRKVVSSTKNILKQDICHSFTIKNYISPHFNIINISNLILSLIKLYTTEALSVADFLHPLRLFFWKSLLWFSSQYILVLDLSIHPSEFAEMKVSWFHKSMGFYN